MATLEDHGVITGVVPIGGGWRYIQVHDGREYRVPVEDGLPSGEHLVEAVKQQRIQLGINIGDPVADVADFVKKVSPPNDRFKGRAKLGVQHHKIDPPLIQRCREWLDTALTTLPDLEQYDDAVERAGICQHCPQNIRWEVHNCGDCNDRVWQLTRIVRRRVDFNLDGTLKACRLHGFHIPCAVFIDRACLPPRSPEAPAACWVLQKENHEPTAQPDRREEFTDQRTQQPGG